MSEEQKNTSNEPTGIDAGEELYAWETWDKPPLPRSKWWYISAGVIAIGLVIYAVLTANYLFGLIILMIGITMLVIGMKEPRRVPVHITNLGVVFADEFYPFKDMKDFSIVYDPPEVKALYIDFKRITHPLVSIDLDEANPNAVRELLLQFVMENMDREEEHFSDVLRRVYKL